MCTFGPALSWFGFFWSILALFYAINSFESKNTCSLSSNEETKKTYDLVPTVFSNMRFEIHVSSTKERIS